MPNCPFTVVLVCVVAVAPCLYQVRAGIGRSPDDVNRTLWKEMKNCCKSIKEVDMDKETRKNCSLQCQTSMESHSRSLSISAGSFQCSPFLLKYLTSECTLSIVCSNSSNITTDALMTGEIRHMPCADRVSSIVTSSTPQRRSTTWAAVTPSSHHSSSSRIANSTSSTKITEPITEPIGTPSERGPVGSNHEDKASPAVVVAVSMGTTFIALAVIGVIVCWKCKYRGAIRSKTSIEDTRVTIEPLDDHESKTGPKQDSEPNSVVNQCSQERTSADTISPVNEPGQQRSIMEDVINPDQDVVMDSSPDNQDSDCSVNTVPQPTTITRVELYTTSELVETTLEHEHHVKTLSRPVPSALLSVTPMQCQPDGCASAIDGTERSRLNVEPGDDIHEDETEDGGTSCQRLNEVVIQDGIRSPEESDDCLDLPQTTDQNRKTFAVSSTKDSEVNDRSHVLILHHDNSEDAADALRITEDLTRNGICCVSHHLEYSKILEMGEKGWLASSLIDCYCVLLVCTKAFRDASQGTCGSHFFVCQRLIAEAVQHLSSAAFDDGVRQPSPRIYPIIRKATDRAFIPDCMQDFHWFQLPSENQWTELISTIRERHLSVSVSESVECIHPLSTAGDSAYGSTHEVQHCTAV